MAIPSIASWVALIVGQVEWTHELKTGIERGQATDRPVCVLVADDCKACRDTVQQFEKASSLKDLASRFVMVRVGPDEPGVRLLGIWQAPAVVILEPTISVARRLSNPDDQATLLRFESYPLKLDFDGTRIKHVFDYLNDAYKDPPARDPSLEPLMQETITIRTERKPIGETLLPCLAKKGVACCAVNGTLVLTRSDRLPDFETAAKIDSLTYVSTLDNRAQKLMSYTLEFSSVFMEEPNLGSWITYWNRWVGEKIFSLDPRVNESLELPIQCRKLLSFEFFFWLSFPSANLGIQGHEGGIRIGRHADVSVALSADSISRILAEHAEPEESSLEESKRSTLKRLIESLKSDDSTRRQSATIALKLMGREARAALRKAWRESSQGEFKSRIIEVLDVRQIRQWTRELGSDDYAECMNAYRSVLNTGAASIPLIEEAARAAQEKEEAWYRIVKHRVEQRMNGRDPQGKRGDRFQIFLDGEKKVQMEFVWIEPGKFTMGLAPEDQGDLADTPHPVKISRGFWIQTTEVTQAQWKAIFGKNPSEAKSDNFPVTGIFWWDADLFLLRLRSHAAGQLKHWVPDMPTEAEWEYACRAGTQTHWSFGDDIAGLNQHAWTSENSNGALQPVSRLKPNPWGLFDMHGNVWEFCRDAYAPFPKEEEIDPVRVRRGQPVITRGGSFRTQAEWASSGYRREARLDKGSDGELKSDHETGFRIILR